MGKSCLNRQEHRKAFIEFFRNKKPKFLIIRSRKLNLTYLEEITGLKYAMMYAGYPDIYQLECSKCTPEPSDFKLKNLYEPGKRYETDKKELHIKAMDICLEGQQLMERGMREIALMEFNQAARMTCFTNLHYLRAILLSDMGLYEEAMSAANEELLLNPTNTSAKELFDKVKRH